MGEKDRVRLLRRLVIGMEILLLIAALVLAALIAVKWQELSQA